MCGPYFIHSLFHLARSVGGTTDQINPKLQHYMDYTIVDPPQSSLHMQRLEPYTYQKVRTCACMHRHTHIYG